MATEGLEEEEEDAPEWMRLLGTEAAAGPRGGAAGGRSALRGFGGTVVRENNDDTFLSPSVLVEKLERLLQDGSELVRFDAEEGQGWGVSGELDDEWHSFKERADGSCAYSDQLQWWTDVPENGWSVGELGKLAELRGRALALPRANLPTAASNPELFAKLPTSPRTAPSRLVAMATARRAAAPLRGGSEHAGPLGGASAGAQESPGPVPLSRAERLKQRLEAQRDYAVRQEPGVRSKVSKEAFKMAAAKAAATRGRAFVAVPAAPASNGGGDGADEADGDEPTAQEEVSAATFLAAVKSRLTEWGKVEQYHQFVVALTGDAGDVNVKACVRILRGHDDLLRVFKYKFAPDADLLKVKAELSEEHDGPQEPAQPPPASLKAVKAEAQAAPPRTPAPARAACGSRAASLPAAAPCVRPDDGPRPPAHPPTRGVKRELVKGEVKAEDVAPRPPRFAPGTRRGVVTIGDDSSEDMDGLQNEASIAAAVRKGRDGCVAQLVQLLFRKERSARDGARERLATARYATQRAACPKFPRELFVLRGVSGIGKTAYAMQQLSESIALDPEDELAARLTHVCAADDFFEQFCGGKAVYRFNANKIESYHRRNEARVRLAMEAGIHPLYVDCTNTRRWEMRPYVELAESLGYVTTVVEPSEICGYAEDLAVLAEANDTEERRQRGKVVDMAVVEAMLRAFEPLHEGLADSEALGADAVDDPLAAIRSAVRGEGPRLVEAAPGGPAAARGSAPSAVPPPARAPPRRVPALLPPEKRALPPAARAAKRAAHGGGPAQPPGRW